MDIEKEDIVFPVVSLIVIVLALYFGIIYDSMVATFLIAWVIMLLLIVGYSNIYKRKNRDLKILKIRYLVVPPTSVVLLYFLYLQSTGYDFSKNELLTINGLGLFFVILVGIGEIVYRRKKK